MHCLPILIILIFNGGQVLNRLRRQDDVLDRMGSTWLWMMHGLLNIAKKELSEEIEIVTFGDDPRILFFEKKGTSVEITYAKEFYSTDEKMNKTYDPKNTKLLRFW